MQDALPDLFQASPDLMYQLVTMVSPTNLQVCSAELEILLPQLFNCWCMMGKCLECVLRFAHYHASIVCSGASLSLSLHSLL